MSYQRVVVLTGAGISQAAGLPTYRGPGGLWGDPALVALVQREALETQRAEAVAMFWALRRAALKVQPSIAHAALAAAEARVVAGGGTFTIVTQNVDSLHQRAGSRNVCEFHGSLREWRCEPCDLRVEPPDGEEPPVHCGALMRPCAVLFGEDIPAAAEHAAKRALREVDLFVAIGTSGTVAPASAFVRWAALNGARRVLLNLESFDGADELFSDIELGTADALVPRWFSERA